MTKLRDLGLAGGLTAALYAAMVLSPAGAAARVWLVPLPGMFLAAARPREVVLWLVIASLALALGINAACSVGFVITLGAATLMIAAGRARSWTLERTIASALGVWIVGVGVLYVETAGGIAAAVSTATAQVDEAFAVALEASKTAGADKEALLLLETQRTSLVHSVLQILPGL
jgi:hypothetical protein